jgi:hypothetical protein
MLAVRPGTRTKLGKLEPAPGLRPAPSPGDPARSGGPSNRFFQPAVRTVTGTGSARTSSTRLLSPPALRRTGAATASASCPPRCSPSEVTGESRRRAHQTGVWGSCRSGRGVCRRCHGFRCGCRGGGGGGLFGVVDSGADPGGLKAGDLGGLGGADDVGEVGERFGLALGGGGDRGAVLVDLGDRVEVGVESGLGLFGSLREPSLRFADRPGL